MVGSGVKTAGPGCFSQLLQSICVIRDNELLWSCARLPTTSAIVAIMTMRLLISRPLVTTHAQLGERMFELFDTRRVKLPLPGSAIAPNRWDWVLLPLVLAILIAIAFGAMQM